MENPYIVVEQKQEKKRRGALAILLAIAFCAILAIGSTFAYLTWTANQTPNRVTTGQLTADLLEPAYTSKAYYDNADTTNTQNAADVVKAAGDGVAIPSGAYAVIPGSQFEKNPFVVNTSKATTAKGYAGIKLEFQKWTSDSSDGDEDGTWTTMSQDEVDKIMKIYNIGTAKASTTAVSGTDKAEAGFKLLGSNWRQINPVKDTVDEGATQTYSYYDNSGKPAVDGSLITAPTTTAYSTIAAPEMYFINTSKLDSLAEVKTNNANNYHEGDNSDNTNWGFELGAYGATTALFNYVTCIPAAEQADLTAVTDMLAQEDTITLGDDKTFTPGWRIVCSGAILQDLVNPTGTSTSGDVADDTKAYIGDMIVKLDAVSDVNGTEDNDSKPTKSTGMRENLNANFSQYWSLNSNSNEYEATNANALPEPAPNNL